MNTTVSIYSVNDFETHIDECLNDVCNHMKVHMGVLRSMKYKSKFEKWFQVELLARLIEKVEYNYDAVVHIEAEVSNKVSKKGEAIDLAIKRGDAKLIGIELKIIPTNYIVDGYEKGTKAVTDGIDGIISDIDKCLSDGYEQAVAIGFVFPLPGDLTHRNHKDWQKQERKLKERGCMRLIQYDFFPNCIARIYILTVNKTEK